MLVFSIDEFMNNHKCYEFLKRVLHPAPAGFCCRRCGKVVPADQRLHKLSSRGTPSFKCRYCQAVFNIFSDTIFQGITYSCITIVLMLRGFLQGKTTEHLSKELKVSYPNLLDWRHKLQEFCFENRDLSVLPDAEVESDEVFINAGEKGDKHNDPEDPPRVRANKKKGLGTYDNDRPPVQGLVGRKSKQIRLEVCKNTRKKTIQPIIDTKTKQRCTIYTDESHAYGDVQASNRKHHSVCHSKKEYARDDDGDGINEVHCNSNEGIWTGLRNFLRPFRGVHKRYMAQYVAMFELTYNFKEVADNLIRALITPDSFLEMVASP